MNDYEEFRQDFLEFIEPDHQTITLENALRFILKDWGIGLLKEHIKYTTWPNTPILEKDILKSTKSELNQESMAVLGIYRMLLGSELVRKAKESNHEIKKPFRIKLPIFDLYLWLDENQDLTLRAYWSSNVVQNIILGEMQKGISQLPEIATR